MKTGFDLSFGNFSKVGECFDTYFGIQAFDRKSSISSVKVNKNYLEIIDGGDIQSYTYAKPTKYFNYVPDNIKSGGDWNVYDRDRVVIRQIGQIPVVGLCKRGILCSNTLYSVFPKDENYSLLYLIGILNSTLIKKYWTSKYSDGKLLFPKIKGYQLKELPFVSASKTDQNPLIQIVLKRVDLAEKLFKLDNNFIEFLKVKFENLSSSMLGWYNKDFSYVLGELKKHNAKLTLTDEADLMLYFNDQKKYVAICKSEIDQIDKEIDRIVYRLYGLNNNEIHIIENT